MQYNAVYSQLPGERETISIHSVGTFFRAKGLNAKYQDLSQLCFKCSAEALATCEFVVFLNIFTHLGPKFYACVLSWRLELMAFSHRSYTVVHMIWLLETLRYCLWPHSFNCPSVRGLAFLIGLSDWKDFSVWLKSHKNIQRNKGFINSIWGWDLGMAMSAQSTTLVQSEISRQRVDGFWWNLDLDFHGPQWINPITIVDLLTFQKAPQEFDNFVF